MCVCGGVCLYLCKTCNRSRINLSPNSIHSGNSVIVIGLGLELGLGLGSLVLKLSSHLHT